MPTLLLNTTLNTHLVHLLITLNDTDSRTSYCANSFDWLDYSGSFLPQACPHLPSHLAQESSHSHATSRQQWASGPEHSPLCTHL